jgi:hypothetical protein
MKGVLHIPPEAVVEPTRTPSKFMLTLSFPANPVPEAFTVPPTWPLAGLRVRMAAAWAGIKAVRITIISSARKTAAYFKNLRMVI